MQQRFLGRTGVSVSELCLGAMMFGAAGNPDHDDSVRIIHRALDAGVNFVDTADAYSAGESETIVGKALAGGRRDDVILATKAWMPMGEDPNRRGNSRRWITTAVEGSLRRLQTDWIDLYQLHRLDPHTDLDEALGALSDLDPPGQDPLRRPLDRAGVADRRGAVDRRAARPRALPHRAAAVLDLQPPRSSTTCCRPASATGSASSPTARSTAAGCRAATARAATTPARARRPGADCSPTATTCRCRSTSASSTRPTRSPRSPRRPA